jgi:hypothetical protein
MFKQEMANLIIAGRKTATRRLPRKSKVTYKAGSIQPIQIDYRHKAIGHIYIDESYTQKLGEMTQEDANKEGFRNLGEFYSYLAQINKMAPHEVFTMLAETVKVYEFHLNDLVLDCDTAQQEKK